MKKYTDAQIEKAKLLRQKEGYSFSELGRLTGIPATTIRNWCTDEDLANTRWGTLLLTNERKRRELKASELSSLNSFTDVDSDEAKILAAIMYACEGSKYPATNKVAFTNSDPTLIKMFISLLRKGFNLEEEKFRIHLQIHTTHDFKKIKRFWHSLLKISKKQSIKPTITSPNGKKHRSKYLGTCTVRYLDYRIQLKLIGIYEEFVRKLSN